MPLAQTVLPVAIGSAGRSVLYFAATRAVSRTAFSANDPAERCWSGRTGLTANQFHPKRVTGVRIPPSPPFVRKKLNSGLSAICNSLWVVSANPICKVKLHPEIVQRAWPAHFSFLGNSGDAEPAAHLLHLPRAQIKGISSNSTPACSSVQDRQNKRIDLVCFGFRPEETKNEQAI
jgi:hypothetical protein